MSRHGTYNPRYVAVVPTRNFEKHIEALMYPADEDNDNVIESFS